MTAADLYRILWRRKVLIAGLTALCVAVTSFVSLGQTPVYEAETLVRIQQRVDDAGQAFDSLEASQRLTETYAEIIESGALAGRVERVLAARTPGIDVSKDDLQAQPVQELELLTISARSPDPNTATLITNAVPPALRNFTRETGTLGDQIATVAPAARPSTPASPKILINVALAFLLGLLVNIGIALLVELLSDRLPEIDDFEEALDLPVLATVPTLDFAREASGGLTRRLRGRRLEPGLDVADAEGSRVG